MGAMTPNATRVPTGLRKTPAIERWDQGFGTRRIGGVRRVVFVQESTCRRVAQQAVEAGFEVVVLRVQDLWTFRELVN